MRTWQQTFQETVGWDRPPPLNKNEKFCRHCGSVIASDCVVCPACGRQVEDLKTGFGGQPNITINNSSSSNNSNVNTNKNTMVNGGGYGAHWRRGRRKSKWVSFFLCLFGGYIGLHKFYEGKPGIGILYACTCGLLCIGWIRDCIVLWNKPHAHYYVD